MQQTSAEKFIHRLFNELWTHPDPQKVSEFYHDNVQGMFGKQSINIGDIKNRASYVKEHYSRIHNEILEVIGEGRKIAVRLKQTYFDKNNVETLCYHLIGTYHIDGDKISHLYCLSDPAFNYYE